jgi:hypothetical protein
MEMMETRLPEHLPRTPAGFAAALFPLVDSWSAAPDVTRCPFFLERGNYPTTNAMRREGH